MVNVKFGNECSSVIERDYKDSKRNIERKKKGGAFEKK